MKVIILVSLFLFSLSCGAPKEQPKIIIGEEKDPEVVVEIENEESTTETLPSMPIGAVKANFISEQLPFYAAVGTVNKKRGIVTIHFEDKLGPNLVIPEAYGATLESLRFDEFDRDLLLVKTTYKDAIFRKYHLYMLQDRTWKEVIDPFILHISNTSEGFVPLKMDPINPNQMIRQYSVFNLDQNSPTKNTWILNMETIPILHN